MYQFVKFNYLGSSIRDDILDAHSSYLKISQHQELLKYLMRPLTPKSSRGIDMANYYNFLSFSDNQQRLRPRIIFENERPVGISYLINLMPKKSTKLSNFLDDFGLIGDGMSLIQKKITRFSEPEFREYNLERVGLIQYNLYDKQDRKSYPRNSEMMLQESIVRYYEQDEPGILKIVSQDHANFMDFRKYINYNQIVNYHCRRWDNQKFKKLIPDLAIRNEIRGDFYAPYFLKFARGIDFTENREIIKN